jgi:opacity protein-like surface antigen
MEFDMKKVLLGACALSFIASANANVICDEVSYTGLFGGLGVVFSFDKDKADLTFANSHVDHLKKNKTAFGGQIVSGYGHQFDSNLYVGIMHESLFASKAATEEKVTLGTSHHATVTGTIDYKRSRKCWTPSFGLAMGYVVDGWNFGLRGGISLEKNKIEQIASENATIGADDEITSTTKSISSTSPYVGAYVEYKMGSFIGYLNVDHVFGKNKTEVMGGTTDAKIDVKHKRSSWKAAAGVKFNVNLLN